MANITELLTGKITALGTKFNTLTDFLDPEILGKVEGAAAAAFTLVESKLNILACEEEACPPVPTARTAEQWLDENLASGDMNGDKPPTTVFVPDG